MLRLCTIIFQLLIDHEEAVAPDPNDPLHEILKELGPSPSVESLLGGIREAGPGEDRQDIINEAGKQEIALTLTHKYESLTKDDSTDMKALFVRYIYTLYVQNYSFILCCYTVRCMIIGHWDYCVTL